MLEQLVTSLRSPEGSDASFFDGLRRSVFDSAYISVPQKVTATKFTVFHATGRTQSTAEMLRNLVEFARTFTVNI